ncbi:2-oxo-4-hydroxy-4-carboxy-5-ureidoimidazoline decarboxylase [Cupriavidus pauculus]|uniref:2-oxo-4-hydroxy-4-carboxy-5-ureidoimidazoline decarboxylase n=1 Tax=Cupriavidus pauculus TaxID=82633 RepID=UPI0012473973|nr:2-oxo-4-hydroxy-4-carboxy-5-ureidoimidazoline decarboxylase [Cupriavidus pauculus]KAB0604599.1 2-oxo-4-hydroxy-4-carboxy-5-ureidoimidazoline decarboxylase [Cupriavidus pauculus]MCM3607021.1 2-oxo-4-hydroxy-4-carboxy-5-ureidoimidazoline decarboxylase [Cupriavidus pauculus]UAK98966.1 2-oxo-4-hydroxy-4-carboxy-5-ureidoimidazoline decarboxylase [Cupriavidus pauculus]
MSQTTYTITQLNAMPEPEFVKVLGGIYEHSPWFAQAAAQQRPFSDMAELAAALRRAVDDAGREAQLKLVRAHPELAGKAAVRGELTAESTREQAGAGLDQCTPEEFQRLQNLNASYNQKFGFPFILAVRGYDRHGIIDAFARRLDNAPDVELQTCINQIHRIAQFRLNDLVSA